MIEKELQIQLLQAEKRLPTSDEDDLRGLESVPETLGWLIEGIRRDPESTLSEADACELMLLGSGYSPAHCAEFAKVMKALGYRDAAKRLRQMSRRKTLEIGIELGGLDQST